MTKKSDVQEDKDQTSAAAKNKKIVKDMALIGLRQISDILGEMQTTMGRYNGFITRPIMDAITDVCEERISELKRTETLPTPMTIYELECEVKNNWPKDAMVSVSQHTSGDIYNTIRALAARGLLNVKGE